MKCPKCRGVDPTKMTFGEWMDITNAALEGPEGKDIAFFLKHMKSCEAYAEEMNRGHEEKVKP